MAKKFIKKDTPKPPPLKPQMGNDSKDRKVKEPPDQSDEL